MTTTLIDIGLFAMLITTAFAIARLNHLFGVVMLSGVFSLLSAMLFITLDAVDVAFTEAAVGAGISTVLMLGTIALTARNEKRQNKRRLVPLLVCVVVGGVLIYGTADMPRFGDPNAPANRHVSPTYLTDSIKDIDVPNVVTSILASYRSFDTMGETAVVFTAGIGVLLILSGLSSRRRREEEQDDEEEQA